MTGRPRLGLTVAAALATALTTLSLTRVVAGDGTLPRWLGAVLVVAIAGAACRRLAAPRAVLPALQLAVLGLYLAVLFAGESALLRLLPTPEALDRLTGLVASGVEEINRSTPPAPPTPGILLITTAVVGVAAVMADACAAVFGRAALAGLPLLVLYSIPAAILPAGLPWPMFALAAVGYVVLLGSEGRERLGRRSGSRPDPGAPPGVKPGTGRRRAPRRAHRSRAGGEPWIGLRPTVTAGLPIAAGAMVLGLAVPLALPDLGGGLLGRLRGTAADPAGGSGVITVVNPIVSLNRNLNQGRSVPLLVTRTTGDPGADGQYLRLVTLDQFDGEQWTPSERPVTTLPGTLPPPDGLAGGVPRHTVRTEIMVTDSLAGAWLPLPYPAMSVDVKGRWRFEAAGRSVVGAQAQTTAGLSYSVTSLVLEPTVAQLNAAQPLPSALAVYTRLPDRLPPSVTRIAEQVVGDAPTPFEKARRLQAWFTDGGHFRYDTSVAPGNGLSAIESFLRDRRGYCEQFAATMAAMARTLGIPARVNVGFTPGTPQADGTRLVDTHDAHAWPELYFTGVGWLRFEPTPTSGTGVLGAPPAHTTAEAAPVSPARPTPSPAAAAAGPADCDARRGDPACAGTAQDTAVPRSAVDAREGGRPSALLWSGPGLAALVAALAPMLLRRRTRRRRLAADTGLRPAASASTRAARTAPVPRRSRQRFGAADPRARALAAWDELRDCAVDLGYGWHPAETPRQAAARLARDGMLSQPATAALDRLAHAAERAGYAGEPPTAGRFADDLRTVHSGLAAHADRSDRVRALLLPRSTLRALRTNSTRVPRTPRRAASRTGPR